MARAKKLKKGQAVTCGGWVMFLTRDEYLFRGKPVVDIKDGETSKTRVPITDVKIYEIPEDEPVTINVNGAASEPTPLGKYERQIINRYGESIIVDVYDVLDAFTVNDAATAHAIKKLLAPGQRGNKSLTQDLNESIQSVERAIDRQNTKFLRG